MNYRRQAELALGRPLDRRHEVHHVDGNRWNNANNNLVICENRAYHRLLHAREKRLAAGIKIDEALPPLSRNISAVLERCQVERLQRLSQADLSSIACIVRRCVIRYLPVLEQEILGRQPKAA